MKLAHAPIWVLFRHVPPELWSFVGFSTIASGVGFPVHSEFSTLKPYSNGVVKLKVVVELAKKRPSSVCVTDSFGNSTFVSAEYPQLPPKCSLCGEFGHLELRCPETVVPLARAGNLVGPICPGSPVVSVSHHVSSSEQAGSVSSPVRVAPTPPVSTRLSSHFHAPLPLVHSSGLHRSISLPLCEDEDCEGSSSGGWIRVARRSKPPITDLVPTSVHHVTSSQFRNEEDIIQVAQQVIRNRCSVNESIPSKRKARKKQRNTLYLLSTESTGSASSSSVASPAKFSVSAPPSPSRGQTQSRFVPLSKA